ncbi:MAG: hypothetical protein K2X93_05350 [Candidatus Obscuribacterales bacterium]|nr:hypothetical protein [Candidatus Obscuribacterales bacterium]
MTEARLKKLLALAFCLTAGIVVFWMVEDVVTKRGSAPASDKTKTKLTNPASDNSMNAPTK